MSASVECEKSQKSITVRIIPKEKPLSLEKERIALLSEIKKINNDHIVTVKTQKTRSSSRTALGCRLQNQMASSVH